MTRRRTGRGAVPALVALAWLSGARAVAADPPDCETVDRPQLIRGIDRDEWREVTWSAELTASERDARSTAWWEALSSLSTSYLPEGPRREPIPYADDVIERFRAVEELSPGSFLLLAERWCPGDGPGLELRLLVRDHLRPLSFEERLAREIREAIGRVVTDATGADAERAVIALDRLWIELVADRGWQASLQNLIASDREGARQLDPVSQALIRAATDPSFGLADVPFRSGDYRLPWLSRELVIAAVEVVLEHREQRRPDATNHVRVVGWTDSSRVRSPIPYRLPLGAGDWPSHWDPSTCDGARSPASRQAGSRGRKEFGTTIESNCELSWARAFEGLVTLGHLAGEFPSADLAHVGGEVHPEGTTQESPFSRKIEVHVTWRAEP